MAKIAKVTDLTKLEGDPDPRRADIQNPRMHLELEASAPWHAGVIKFIARCSERSPVARALVVSILIVLGLACVAVTHLVLGGLALGWIISLGAMFIPAGLYGFLARRERCP